MHSIQERTCDSFGLAVLVPFNIEYTDTGISRVWQVRHLPWAPLRGFSAQCSHMGTPKTDF